MRRLKLQVSLRKRATNYRALLRKMMTYEQVFYVYQRLVWMLARISLYIYIYVYIYTYVCGATSAFLGFDTFRWYVTVHEQVSFVFSHVSFCVSTHFVEHVSSVFKHVYFVFSVL